MVHKRSAFEINNWMMLPVVIAVLFAFGFVFSIMSSTHDWGILIPVTMTPYLFAIVFVEIWLARVSKIRTEFAGGVIGLIGFISYLLGEMIGSCVFEGIPLASWYPTRWGDGVELFGAGSFAITSWIWAFVYLVKLGVLGLCIPYVFIHEGERQFCDLCRTHSTRKIWKKNVGRFDPSEIEGKMTLRELLELSPNPNGTHAVRIRVRGCKCLSLCELHAEKMKNEDEFAGDTIIEMQSLTPLGISRLIEWVIRVDPDVIDEQGITRLTSIGGSYIAFDHPIEPEGDEWRSIMRWGSMTAMEWYADTEYTQALRGLISKGDYRAVEDALGASININDTACIYEASADWSALADWIDLWCDDDLENSAAHCVRGIHYVKLAWIKRGSGWTPKNYGEFQALLSEAMRSLDRATELEPYNRVAHAWKIYAGKGLGQDHMELRKYFDAACTLGPDDPVGTQRDMLAAHWMYFDAITPKWGGSKKMLLDFADECLSKCPDGCPGLAVVPFVYNELSEIASSESKIKKKIFFTQNDVRSQIVSAYKKAFTNHRTSMVTPRIRAIFAGTLWHAGELELARQQLERMGKITPWAPFVSSVFFFSKQRLATARKACGI